MLRNQKSGLFSVLRIASRCVVDRSATGMHSGRCSSLRWIGYFPAERSSVGVSQSISRYYPITNGAPQRSVLWPLLALHYVNDLPSLFVSPLLIYTGGLKLWNIIQSPVDVEIKRKDLTKLEHFENHGECR